MFEADLSIHYYKNDLQNILDEAIALRDKTMMVHSKLNSIFHDILPDVVTGKSTNLIYEDFPQD